MTTLTQSKVPLQFLLSEADGQISRDKITILSGEGKLSAGTILGRTATTATATVTAKSGNTGTGAFTIDGTTPVLSTAKRGRYVVECIEPAANLGTFQVTDPKGVVLGSYIVGASAFATDIKFTIADATDFVAGDAFFVDVAITAFKYRSADPTNTDGSDVALAVLGYPVDATSADVDVMAITRHAEVKADELVYDANVDNATKKALKVVQLSGVTIIVR